MKEIKNRDEKPLAKSLVHGRHSAKSSRSFLMGALGGLECLCTDPKPPPPHTGRLGVRGVERLSAKEQKRLSWRLWSQDQEGARLFFQQKTTVTNVSRESSGWRPGCALSWGDCPITAAEAPRRGQSLALGAPWSKSHVASTSPCFWPRPPTATYMPRSPSSPWGRKLPPQPIR